jgi:hypothetical protein
MNGKRIFTEDFLLTLPLAIGAGGLGGVVVLVFAKYGRLWGLSLDVALLSVGVLLLVQAAFIRRDHREKVEQKRVLNAGDLQGFPLEDDILEDDVRPTQFGLAFILAAIAGLLSLVPSGSQAQNPAPPDQIQSLIQLLEQTESDLNECAKAKAPERCKPGDDAVAARIEELLHRHEDILKSFISGPQSPPTQNGAPPWRTILLVGFALLFVGAIIWLTLALSPSKTPLAITAALVTGMIKGAKQLPQPGGDFYWYSIFGLLLIGGLAVLIAAVRWKSAGPGALGIPPTTGTPGPVGSSASTPPESLRTRIIDRLFKKSPERPDTDSPMVIGFSILLLACAMAYLGKAQDKSSAAVPTKPCPACPAISTLRPTKQDWQPVRGFGERERAAETSDLAQFKHDLESRKLTDADLLLLLGSADCVKIRAKSPSGADSNKDLAKRRADFVKVEASKLGLVSLPTILTSTVSQAERCSKTLDQRAVYPILFSSQGP